MKKDLRIIEHPMLTFNRRKRIRFTFNGREIVGFEGETIAGSLYAAGVRIFSRSFKYHRPRGLFCLSGHCDHCLMRVDGVPNVRTCSTPLREGMKVESQNAWPSLKFDITEVANYFDFLVRPGFQYRRFKRHRRIYHIWERFLRKMAGIGNIGEKHPNKPVQRIEAFPEILIVGGGIAGMSAFIHAAEAGAKVWLMEKDYALGGSLRYETAEIQLPNIKNKRGFEIVAEMSKNIQNITNCKIVLNATVFGAYEDNVLAAVSPEKFFVLQPKKIIISTGSYENPLVFENNDLPGIFLSSGIVRLMHRDGVKPGNHAVVYTRDTKGYNVALQLLEAGVEVKAIVDSRAKEKTQNDQVVNKLEDYGIPIYFGYNIKAAVGHRHVKKVIFKPCASSGISEKEIPCDTLCISGSLYPANDLVFQLTCQGENMLQSKYDYLHQPKISSPIHIEEGLYSAGGINGAERPSDAFIEGKRVGLAAAMDLGYRKE